MSLDSGSRAFTMPNARMRTARPFRFSARLLEPGKVEVRYDIAPGYYMYREKFKFSADPASVTVDAAQLPAGQIKKDEFFGNVQIYRGKQVFVLPVGGADAANGFLLKAVSQGCADIGVCYPPQEQRANLKTGFSTAGPAPGVSGFVSPAPTAASAPAAQSEDALIADLFKGGFLALVASFFGFGLLLALTPCVFPMIPILSGILVPHGEHLTHARGFALSLAYVLGMAITYALAGVAAGLLGTMLSSALQTPWVLGGFAALFVVLAMSMFGFYDLQMPNALQSKLTVTSNKLHGGHFASVFGMGILSALIVGPCVAAPLAGALVYISQTKNVVIGGVALFALASGMSVPSSPQATAPASAVSPPRIHTAKKGTTWGRCVATMDGDRKMPMPLMEPATMAMRGRLGPGAPTPAAPGPPRGPAPSWDGPATTPKASAWVMASISAANSGPAQATLAYSAMP